jgi:hypothetical protein
MLRRKYTGWQPVLGIEHIKHVHVLDHELYHNVQIPLTSRPDSYEFTCLGSSLKFCAYQSGGPNRV